ncbi:MAG: thiolase family protein [Euryarchaeota archaeon]|nr:thiolase family protein [Euryarchaeota archaeon]
MSVAIASTGLTKFGRRNEGLIELLVEAGREALEGAPASARRPDCVVVGSMAAGALAGLESLVPRVANGLGLAGLPGWRVESASATGAGAFQLGAHLVASSAFERVLVLAGEKMTAQATGPTTTALARSLSANEVRHGATMPSIASLLSQLYLARYHLSIEDVAEVTVRNRACAQGNPKAQFPSAVTAAQVNESRMVSSPLRLLHVSAISDGAGAVLLTRPSSRESVVVRGMGQATDVLEVASRPMEPLGFRATRQAARAAYDQAGVGRKEVQTSEVHDAFAPFQLIDLEDLGFCGPGEGLAWTRAGRGDPNGVLPVNPSGGLLGRGHPVGVSGLAQIIEVDRQLRGEAGRMQAGSPRVGLAQSVGGLGSHNFVTILGREQSA